MTTREEKAATEAVRRRLLDAAPVQADELALEALRAAEAVHRDDEAKREAKRKARTLRQAWAFLVITLLVLGAVLIVATSG